MSITSLSVFEILNLSGGGKKRKICWASCWSVRAVNDVSINRVHWWGELKPHWWVFSISTQYFHIKVLIKVHENTCWVFFFLIVKKIQSIPPAPKPSDSTTLTPNPNPEINIIYPVCHKLFFFFFTFVEGRQQGYLQHARVSSIYSLKALVIGSFLRFKGSIQ